MAGVTADLELQISSALDSVSSVGDALTGVASTFSDEIAKAIAAAAETQVSLTIDTSALSGEVDQALAAAQPTIAPAVDQEALATQIDDAAARATPEVEVSIDAGALGDEIEEVLGQTDTTLQDVTAAADGTAGSFDGLTAAATGVTAATELAEGSTGALAGAMSRAGGVIAGVSAVGLALGSTYGLLFGQALEAQAAEERLNLVFGEQAAAIQQLDIGGLTGDMGELAVSIGSNDEALKNAVASLGQMAQANGNTADEVQRHAQTVAALALRAVALNPALGEVGDVAQRMGTALARGGRFAAAFSISLNPAEVAARALRDTGKSTAAELTIVDKAMAGAAITAERLGGKLGKDFAAGAEQTTVKLKALRQSLAETFEKAGAGLVDPTIDALEQLTPVAGQLAEALGEILVALTPVITSLVSAFAPALEGAADAVGLLAIPLGVVAKALDLIPAPVLQGVAAFLTLRALLPVVAVGAMTLVNAFDALTVAIAANPIGLIAAGLAIAAAAMGLFSGSAKQAEEPVASLKEQLDQLDQSGQNLSPTLTNLNQKLRVILTGAQDTKTGLTDVFTDSGFREALEAVGLDLNTTIRLLQQGKVGAAEFEAALSHALTFPTGGSGGTALAEQIAKQDEILGQFKDLQRELDKLAKAEIGAAVASKTVSTSTVAQLEATNRLADGTVDYLAVARAVEVIASSQAGAMDQLAGSLGDNAAAWRVLADGIVDGSITLRDLPAISDRTGISLDKLTTAFDGAQKAIGEWVNEVHGKIPAATDVLGQIDKGFDPRELTRKLREGADAIRSFFADTLIFQQEGLLQTVALAQQLGPLQGGILLNGLQQSTPKVRQEFEAQLGAYRQAGVDALGIITGQAPILAGATGALAAGMNGALGTNLNFATPTQLQLEATRAVMSGDTSLAAAAAILAATGTGAYGQHLLLAGVTTGQLLAAATAVQREQGLTTGATLAGEAATRALKEALKLQGVTDEQLDNAGKAIEEKAGENKRPVQAGRKTGEAVGRAISKGIALGVSREDEAISEAIVATVRKAERDAKRELGIKSPSALFAEQLGVPLAQGVALGFRQGLGDFASTLADLPRVTLRSGVVADAASIASAASTTTNTTSTRTVQVNQTFNERIDPDHAARAAAFAIGG